MTSNGGEQQQQQAAASPQLTAASRHLPAASGSQQNRLALFNSRRQWWNLCFVYGDQTKYYRQLYGKRRPIKRIEDKCTLCASTLENVDNR